MVTHQYQLFCVIKYATRRHNINNNQLYGEHGKLDASSLLQKRVLIWCFQF